MKSTFLVLLFGVAIAGLVGGYLGGKAAGTRAESPPGAEAEDPASNGSGGKGSTRGAGGRNAERGPAAVSSIRSADTLDDLLALPEEGLFGRMALWLMDASPEDIATYWEKRKEKEHQDRDIKDLVMIGWTRVDPEGATAALAGSNDEHYAWWAWACHDPETALQAAIDGNPARIGNVAWGIGEFHPKWLRENFDQIPESGRGQAMQGLLKWGEVDDAMATLEFLKEQKRTPPKDLMRNMVRQDPWAAYEWFEKNGSSLSSYYGSQDHSMNMLIGELADSHPDVLQQLIARQPSGARKREMEAASFRNLLTLDLDAALEEASAIPAPRIQAERLATVGTRVARSDPDRAFEIARDLFTQIPDALNQMTSIAYPDGGSSASSGGNSTAGQLLNMLVAHDPARAMALFEAAPQEGGNEGEGALSGAIIGATVGVDPFGGYHSNSVPRQRVASQWAELDLEGFAEWVVQEDDPATTDQFAPTVLTQLQNQFRFDEAGEWALSIGQDSTRRSHLRNLVNRWQRTDPDGARQWVESAELSEDESQQLQQLFQSNQ